MTDYLLDANVFIQAKNLHYGFDFCPAFWDWLVQQNHAGKVASLHFSPHGEAKCVRGPSGRGASRLARAGVLDGTLSTASKRNEVMAVVSRASTVGW